MNIFHEIKSAFTINSLKVFVLVLALSLCILFDFVYIAELFDPKQDFRFCASINNYNEFGFELVLFLFATFGLLVMISKNIFRKRSI